jgi:hypothetical protein
MQFLALANHNNYAENLNLPIISDLTLIPAVEWTHYKGHVNFFGLTKPFEQNFTANSTSEAQKIMDYARQLGAIVSMNHPLDSNCPYLWDKEGFQFMEVWNGPMRPDNQKAIEWWKNQLEKGKHVIALGGSDFHRKGLVSLGNPVTGILSKSRSVLDLLEGIREGHVYIRSGIHGPVLALACQESTFGDSVKIGAGVDVKIIANSLHWYQALLIHTNKTIHRVRPTHGKIETILPIKEPGFLFLEVIMKIPFWTDHYTCAISNPIYFE